VGDADVGDVEPAQRDPLREHDGLLGRRRERRDPRDDERRNQLERADIRLDRLAR
jgi:hypothetical protein